MQGSALSGTFKTVGYVVVVLIASAMAYAGYISLKYWAGIGV